jgi:carboxylesterase
MFPYMQGASPYFYHGNSIGCLVLHGLMASPDEPRWLGEYLAREDYSVCGVRFAGHGLEPRAMRRVGWRDWLVSAIDGYHMLATTCEKIMLIGHSMGGTIAMLLASDARVTVDALCMLGSPVRIESRTARTARWLRFLVPYTNQPDTSPVTALIRAEQARRGEPERGRVRYDRWATRGVAETVAAADAAYARLDKLTMPTLAIYARHDSVIAYRNLALIQDRIAARPFESITLERSGHNIVQDCERETVFAAVADFARRHLG